MKLKTITALLSNELSIKHENKMDANAWTLLQKCTDNIFCSN